MIERYQLLRKLRRIALWGLAGVTAAGTALLAALWVSALADPVPSRRFTYRDGTFDYHFGWENIVHALPHLDRPRQGVGE